MVRYKSNDHKRTRTKKLILIIVFLIVVGGGLLFMLEKTNTTSLFSPDQDELTSDAKTTSDVPSAQSDFNGGSAAEENKDPGNTVSENKGTATVTDNNGAASSDTSKPSTSSTGEITVYLPHESSLLSSGQELSGTSSLSTVQYRLIDNVSGVIASGSLKVVNNNFSGTLNFSTTATEGRLDIFATRSDATEYSVIEIPVRFK